MEFCEENEITIKCFSACNPISNLSTECNLGILKRLLAKSAKGGDDFAEAFFALQNMPRTSDGLSPARLFFQRQVRVPMLPQPRCDKDELGAGYQQHYDREHDHSVRNARIGKSLASPLDLYVGQQVFLQDELKKNKPYLIPGKVISVRENCRSVFVYCPGKF